jgi:hypothetical protein
MTTRTGVDGPNRAGVEDGPGPAAVAAARAAEAVREVNHATIAHDAGYGWPCDVYDVLGHLGLAVARLPQALTQAGAWLETADARGVVGHDQGDEHAVEAVLSCVWLLHDAATTLAEVAAVLRAAHEHASHLTTHEQGSGGGR